MTTVTTPVNIHHTTSLEQKIYTRKKKGVGLKDKEKGDYYLYLLMRTFYR